MVREVGRVRLSLLVGTALVQEACNSTDGDTLSYQTGPDSPITHPERSRALGKQPKLQFDQMKGYLRAAFYPYRRKTDPEQIHDALEALMAGSDRGRVADEEVR
jgi:hypothetical protein